MSPSAGRFLGRDPIGYFVSSSLYIIDVGLRKLDPSGKFSEVDGGGKGTRPKGIKQDCMCCCCPVGIAVTSTVRKDEWGTLWYVQNLDINFKIRLRYYPAPKNAKDVSCSLSFLEFVTSSTNIKTPIEKGYWVDQVARQKKGVFKEWVDFESPESKNCNGESTVILIDESGGGFNTWHTLDFWQWIGVTGGKDCGCDPPSISVLTHVHYNPPSTPTMNRFTSPFDSPGIPEEVKPLPSF
jgi:hypothetical protein